MHEIVVNLHIHTPYSDGSGSHVKIASTAIEANLDCVIVTDHNVLVKGLEGYYKNGTRKVLMIIGEEIHDQARQPQKNHLLVFGVDRELATLAYEPQRLLDSIRRTGGLAFLAHLFDPANKPFNQPDLSWVDWEVDGYTGIELWNSLTELKSHLKSKMHGVFYALYPQFVAHGPQPETIEKWDELTTSGKRIVAIGGSDAHALLGKLGPLKREIFPYEFHFRAINTHLLVQEPLNGDLEHDKGLILNSLRQGHAFIGYDLPTSTHGFRFTAQGRGSFATMGDEISAEYGVTLKIRLPQQTECRLLKDGNVQKTWDNRNFCTFITTQPGVYRVEVYIQYLGKRRGWIFSNPIYVRA